MSPHICSSVPGLYRYLWTFYWLLENLKSCACICIIQKDLQRVCRCLLTCLNTLTYCLDPRCPRWACSAAGAVRSSGSSGRLLQIPPEACGRAKFRWCLHRRRDCADADVTGAVWPPTAGSQSGGIRQSHGPKWLPFMIDNLWINKVTGRTQRKKMKGYSQIFHVLSTSECMC